MTASMRVGLIVLVVASLLVSANLSDATLREKLIVRRQAEAERETTSASPAQPPERLYPDLPQPPSQSSLQSPPHGGHHFAPTPFVPFGLAPPATVGSRLNNPMNDPLNPFRPIQQARPMSPSERMQSQSFTSGLGRRLLSMIGIDPPTADANGATTGNNTDASSSQPANLQPLAGAQEAMRALRNSTVLQQLNNGVQSIYGNLSKMYNSTVQQQLDLLQERLQRETANSTNPWQQRMAQQIPMYFKSMTAKVESAQEGLNRLWHQMMHANNGTLDQNAQSRLADQLPPNARGFFGSFEHLMSPNGVYDEQMHQPDNFFNQVSRSFGFGGQPGEQMGANGVPQDRPADFGTQLMGFWHNQVQPQVNVLRGQIMRTWRDLTSSGALAPEQMFRSRASGNNLGANQGENSSDVVDSILSSVDMSGAEYSLVEPTGDQQANGSSTNPNLNSVSSKVATQIQNRLTSMQRDVNQLWIGLSGALQNALTNVNQSLNPRSRFRPVDSSKRDEDPAANEIDSKIKDLSSLQRDADVVYEVVQQQQQQQQQVRPSIGDRFRGFINNAELEQLPNRVSDSVSRFGHVVGDLWGQIPERWDNFVQNFRPNEQNSASARLAASTTQKPNNP